MDNRKLLTNRKDAAIYEHGVLFIG
jgi:hypothetical protein